MPMLAVAGPPDGSGADEADTARTLAAQVMTSGTRTFRRVLFMAGSVTDSERQSPIWWKPTGRLDERDRGCFVQSASEYPRTAAQSH